jgi:hypothetical protein
VNVLRNTRARSIVLSLLVLAFLGGIGLFVYRFVVNANYWALSPINKHFSGVNLSSAGKIWECLK